MPRRGIHITEVLLKDPALLISHSDAASAEFQMKSFNYHCVYCVPLSFRPFRKLASSQTGLKCVYGC